MVLPPSACIQCQKVFCTLYEVSYPLSVLFEVFLDPGDEIYVPNPLGHDFVYTGGDEATVQREARLRRRFFSI